MSIRKSDSNRSSSTQSSASKPKTTTESKPKETKASETKAADKSQAAGAALPAKTATKSEATKQQTKFVETKSNQFAGPKADGNEAAVRAATQKPEAAQLRQTAAKAEIKDFQQTAGPAPAQPQTLAKPMAAQAQAQPKSNNIIGDFWHGATDKLGDAVNNTRDAIGTAVNNTRDAVGTAVNNTRDAVGTAVNNTRDAVGTAVNNTRDAIGTAVNNTRDAIGTAVDNTREAVGTAVNGTREAVGNVVNGTKEKLLGALEGAKDVLTGIGKETGLIEQNRVTGPDGKPGAVIPDGRIDTIKPGQALPGAYAGNNLDQVKLKNVDQFTQQAKMYHVNGIRSDADTRTTDAAILANMTGKPVNLVNNNTKGGVADVVECAEQLVGGKSNPATDALANALTKDMEKLMQGKPLENGDRNIVVSAHSQGGILATHAMSQAITNLKGQGYSDQQIRDMVSKHVQVNLMGSPANPLNNNPANPQGQAISFVPPLSGEQKPNPAVNKELGWYFGGAEAGGGNVRDRVYESGQHPNPPIPAGPGFNTIRNSGDPVGTSLRDIGVDDKAKLDNLNHALNDPIQPWQIPGQLGKVKDAVGDILGTVGPTGGDFLEKAKNDGFGKHDVSGMAVQPNGAAKLQNFDNAYFGNISSAYGRR